MECCIGHKDHNDAYGKTRFLMQKMFTIAKAIINQES